MREDLNLKDYLDRESLERIQLQCMRETLDRVYSNNACYRRKSDDLGVHPNESKS